MQDPIIDQFLDAFKASGEDVSLSNEEREFIKQNPKLLSKLWKETSQAVLLHAFPNIMAKQIEKAISGDTTSAKFLTEFITPEEDDTNENIVVERPQWEQLATALRDRLGLELSGQDLVVNLLTAIAEQEDSAILDILGGSSVRSSS
jgi:hypothetical protein